jgi:hypothetical protein
MGAGKTEWEDILIEKGIIKPPPSSTEALPDIIYSLSNKNEHTSDADSSGSDFDLDNDNDYFLKQYTQKRLAELQQSPSTRTFGELVEISRQDFMREVTEASQKHPVLLYLYQSSLVECQLVGKWLKEEAAGAFPGIKFVQMVATRCIPNYPDANLPTILLYRRGAVQRQLLHTNQHQILDLAKQILAAESNLVQTEPPKGSPSSGSGPDSDSEDK